MTSLKAFLDDAVDVIDILRIEWKIKEKHIQIIGKSFGTCPACLIAEKKAKLEQLGSNFSFTTIKDVTSNLPKRFGWFSPPLINNLSKVQKISNLNINLGCFHGSDDKLITSNHSELVTQNYQGRYKILTITTF
jgi:hypothetical protein